MSPAAYERMSSRAAGSTWVRPRTVLTMTGKKTMRAEIVIRGSTLSEPNQLIVIGANARIGIELAPIADRDEDLAGGRPAGRRQAGDRAQEDADDEPADRLGRP